jgi:hypothetical protein
MFGPRQQRILTLLDDHPDGLVVEHLLPAPSTRAARQERAKTLDALHRLVAAGLVNLIGKRHRTEIAGALVMRATPLCGAQSAYPLPAGQVSSPA